MVPHQGLLCTKHLIIIIASLASCVHLCLERETASRLLGGSYLLGRPAPAGPHLRWPRNRQGWQRHRPFACLPSEEEPGPSVGGMAMATVSQLRHLLQQRRLRQEPACPPRPQRADSGVKWGLQAAEAEPSAGHTARSPWDCHRIPSFESRTASCPHLCPSARLGFGQSLSESL